MGTCWALPPPTSRTPRPALGSHCLVSPSASVQGAPLTDQSRGKADRGLRVSLAECPLPQPSQEPCTAGDAALRYSEGKRQRGWEGAGGQTEKRLPGGRGTGGTSWTLPVSGGWEKGPPQQAWSLQCPVQSRTVSSKWCDHVLVPGSCVCGLIWESDPRRCEWLKKKKGCTGRGGDPCLVSSYKGDTVPGRRPWDTGRDPSRVATARRCPDPPDAGEVGRSMALSAP